MIHRLICDIVLSDVDECEIGTNNCDQICSNTDGSFTCSCEDGFRLSVDGHSCVGMCRLQHIMSSDNDDCCLSNRQ